MTDIIELRQYTMRVGTRETLIDLFDRALTHGQEAVGMSVLGQFRDLDDANRFVWLRRFATMTQRVRALGAFYDGPVWAQHRAAANATILDASNVLLLRPAEPGASFKLARPERQHGGFVETSVLELDSHSSTANTLEYFRVQIAPALTAAGASLLGYFVTAALANDFPRLPVREGVNALVWVAGYSDGLYIDGVLQRARGEIAALAAQAPGARRDPEIRRLVPTSGSLIAGTSPACAASARFASLPDRKGAS